MGRNWIFKKEKSRYHLKTIYIAVFKESIKNIKKIKKQRKYAKEPVSKYPHKDIFLVCYWEELSFF